MSSISVNTIRPPSLDEISRDGWTHSLFAGEFFLTYQPIVGFDRVIAMEALLRWQSREYGLVSPAAFIPALEKTGAIEAIGTWVLEQACVEALSWTVRGHKDVAVAVNISPVQLGNPGFAKIVADALHRSRLPPRLLKLEITESLATHGEPTLIKALHEIRDYGVSLSLDDFGTGYANLLQMLHLPVSEIKIDRGFVESVLHSDTSKAVIEVVIKLASLMNLHVVAEGIENKQQHDYMADAGCHAFQGYWFGAPCYPVSFDIGKIGNEPGRFRFPTQFHLQWGHDDLGMAPCQDLRGCTEY